MQDLTFVGLSEDGSHLVLALPDGRRFGLAIDDRLRAATRVPQRTQSAQSQAAAGMRPRDIQARLRAGATVDEVAELAGWPVERVEAFGVPVLQERSFVAQRAQRSLVRHGEGERPLDEVVVHRLAERGVDSIDFRWDAWRREDGIWSVLLAYPGFPPGTGDRVATWSFDIESRTLHPLDDEAKWLTSTAQGVEGQQARAAAGEPAEEPVEAGGQVVSFTGAKNRPGAAEEQGSRHPAGRRLPEKPAESAHQASQQEASDEESDGDGDGAAPQEVPPRPAPARRPAVPSWDDILFGTAPRDS